MCAIDVSQGCRRLYIKCVTLQVSYVNTKKRKQEKSTDMIDMVISKDILLIKPMHF